MENRYSRGREKAPEHRINKLIVAPEVRLSGSDDPEMNGIFPTEVALKFAEELEVDLVEIVPQAVPPVCRLVPYSKFRYEQKRREKENKAKQHVVIMKEIRFGPNTDDHDFDFKLKHAQKFLKEGNKVKAYVTFYGRTIVYKDRGEKLLMEFAKALEDLAKIEMAPKLEGKRMFLVLSPTKIVKP
jgi:translation initiation factor IF-3